MTDGKLGDPRRVTSLLANADTRRAYAQVVLGYERANVAAHLNPSRRKRVVDALLSSGLAIELGDGTMTDSDTIFRAMLKQHPAPVVATGIDRFVLDGRIVQYPSNVGDRIALLEWVADGVVGLGETIDEKQINERLKSYTEDFALLRRYLVDFGLVERTRSGATYTRALSTPS